MKLRNLIVPVCMIVAIGGAFFVPKDVVVLWVFLWAALGAGLRNWVFPDPRQHRDYRPSLGQLLIYHDSDAISIKRNGLELRIVIAKNGFETEQIWISEPGQGPDRSFCTDGVYVTKAFFGDGQTLVAKRHKKGYLITWPVSESPWELVEK